MAPGRRRTKGGTSKSELNLGDLVLAKVKGHPAWPAKVDRPEAWKKTPDPKKCFVNFFGTNEIAFVAPSDIQAFTTEVKNTMSARCKGKTGKYFAKAVKEICEEFEELQHKKSSGMIDVIDRPDCGSVDPSPHVVVDHAKNVAERPDGDSEMKILDNHCCGLEDCLQRQCERDLQEIKLDVSCIVKKSKPSTDGAVVPKEEEISSSSPLQTKEESFCDTERENAVVHDKHSGMVTHTGGVNANRNSCFSDTKGEASGRGEDRSSPMVHDKYLGSGRKEVMNGYKSKNLSTGSKRRLGGTLHGKKNSSSGSVLSSGLKDSSTSELRSNLDVISVRKGKKLLKDNIRAEGIDDLSKVAKGNFKPADMDNLAFRKMKRQTGHGKHNLATEVLNHAKRSKFADVTLDTTLESPQTNRKSGGFGVKPSDLEVRKPISQGKGENPSAPRASQGSFGSSSPGDEDVLPPSKRRRHTHDVISGTSATASDVNKGRHLLSSDKVKPLVSQFPTKRRAVCLYDDDDEEVTKTPVHGGSTRKADVHSDVSDSIKKNSAHSEKSTRKQEESDYFEGGPPIVPVSTVKFPSNSSPNSHQHLEMNTKALTTHISCSHAKINSDKMSCDDSKPVLVSPKRSPASISVANLVLDDVEKSVVEALKANRHFVKGSSSNSPRDSLSGANRNSVVIYDHPDKMSRITNLKIEHSATSMKHLIAVAQAKRKEAQSQIPFFGNSMDDFTGGSPLYNLSVSSSMLQPNMQGYYGHSSLASPPSHLPQLSNNQPEVEEFEDQRVCSGHRAAGDLLSGGTEAAVTRDTFEGMIETLSRTKESIGRATRLAIDCAKYGIAGEVVDLLISKLETESGLHRKVDLFFLVDSITQCSHSQKGIVGESYIPTIQAALPRLIVAAAPPGAAARENRRQCLKVLRLWLERKILPESLLRSCMDDIGGSNDDTSSEFSRRRPSRAERAIDDPIREMEGMLVDEYGSNATFQLPGFLCSRVLDEDEEEEEEERFLKNSFEEYGNKPPCELASTTREAETSTVTPNDRRHCILEDVDGELEMEDVSGHPKDERVRSMGGPFGSTSNVQNSDFRTTPNSSTELSSYGSPPLPLDSPPSTPPLPSSPPLPSFLPSSLLPLPPPPSQVHPHSTPPSSMQPSLVPQSSVLPQPSGYNPRRPLEYVCNGLYTIPQVPLPNQQFQPGNFLSTQRAFQPGPPPQIPSSQFLFSVPTFQQHSQQIYPPQYTLLHHPDEKWRMATKEFSANQHGLWLIGGRSSADSMPFFAQEDNFQPTLERPSSNNVGFQLPAINTPAGHATNIAGFQPPVFNTRPAKPSVPGHGGPQMMPSKPELSFVSSWRPP